MTEVVIGVDIGGTSSRALAVRADGVVVGRGSAGGGNPNSHPYEVAAGRVASAVAEAIPADATVVGCMLGLAGDSKFTDPAVVEAFDTALRAVGVTGPINEVSDAEVAFASATSSPEGTVLIGGTGSIAARIVNRRLGRWCGGWGWLLGDEGSAYWLGREAVRTTLRLLQGSAEPGALASAVLTEALGSADVSDRRRALSRLITSANAEPPIRLARFAALVSEHAEDDRLAASIIEEAATLLAAHAHAVREPGETTPIVLAGSVIDPERPVGIALRKELSGEAEVLFAPDGTTGAAWLAAIEAWGEGAPRPIV